MLGAILALAVVAPEDARLPVALDWSAPPGCASQAELEDDIARLTGARLAEGEQAERLEVRISTVQDGYAMALRRTRADGSTADLRELVAADCGVLARAAALIVAVGVDPLATAAQVETLERAAARAEPVLAPSPATDVAPAPVVRPATVSPPVRARRWRHRFVMGALGGLAIGAVPGPSGSVGGFVGYAFGPLRFELGGEHTFARRRTLDDGVRVAASSSGGGLLVAITPQLGPLVGVFGTGVQAGVLRGTGSGARVAGSDALDWWAAIPLVAGLEWPARSRIALRVQAELAISLRRPALTVRSGGDPAGGFRRAEATARVLAGPIVRLP